MGFLDYLLKSYLNGGTFDEDVLQAYETNQVGLDVMKERLIDFRRELRMVRRAVSSEERALLPEVYLCLRDMFSVEEEQPTSEDTFSNYHSAFRIIGTVEKAELGGGSSMLVTPGFNVESDLNVKPQRAADVVASMVSADNTTTTAASQHISITEAFHKMRLSLE